MAEEMIELTSERDTVAGTVPRQFRPFIYINRRLRVRVLGFHVRPRIVLLALLALAGVYGLARVVLGGRSDGP